MAETNRSTTFGGQDVAVFIDFENIYISVLAEYDVNPDFEALIEKAEAFGRVSVAQAYADWTPYSHYINSLHAYQIDPMYVPAYHYGEGGKQKGGAIKNSVDMFLCINAMKMLYSHPNIQTFVLVTGDRDFVPLVKTIREFGKRAVVIGVAGAASSHLAQSADEFFFYHQITDNLRPPEREKPKVRDPYETLVEAVKLARQRGYVATLASLKLLMAELMGEFDESKYKDGRGKPIQRFKDFVKEAERRNKVKLFSTGTINEVFLPNEDPRKTSRFVEEVLAPAEPVDEADEPAEAEEEARVDVEISPDQWKLFINAMSPLEGAVPFVRVFDVMRGLRNQGLLDLSNKELKSAIIKAIHLNLLVRSNRGRGRRTFYQLTNDPAVLGQYIELSTPKPVAEMISAVEDMSAPVAMSVIAEPMSESVGEMEAPAGDETPSPTVALTEQRAPEPDEPVTELIVPDAIVSEETDVISELAFAHADETAPEEQTTEFTPLTSFNSHNG
ncbi:MAG: NYN domain-containing protein [Chloroflexota bacterium]